jgi:hypothetical protein
MSDAAEPQRPNQVRWAVTAKMGGRVMVEAETADVNRDNGSQYATRSILAGYGEASPSGGSREKGPPSDPANGLPTSGPNRTTPKRIEPR